MADTYSWQDSSGNTHFSDNPASVPGGRGGKVTVGEDITLENPEVRESVAEGRRRTAELQREDRLKQQERDRARRLREQQELQAQAREGGVKKSAVKQAASGGTPFKRSGAT